MDIEQSSGLLIAGLFELPWIPHLVYGWLWLGLAIYTKMDLLY